MLALIVPLGCLLMGAWALGVMLKAPLEQTFSLSCMAVILGMYTGIVVSGGHLALAARIMACGLVAMALGVLAYLRVYARSRVASDFDGEGNSKREWISFLAVVALVCVALVWLDYGRVASLWDEFSHWMDVIKAMIGADDLATNPAAHSHFVNYPPATALFECFFQTLPRGFMGNGALVEWTMYCAYQILCIALLMPAAHHVGGKRSAGTLGMLAVLVLLTFTFYPHFFKNLQVDALIAIVSAASLLVILFGVGEPRWRLPYVTMVCATLVLTKAIGTFFAALIALCYLASCVLEMSVRPQTADDDATMHGRHAMKTAPPAKPAQRRLLEFAKAIVPLVAVGLAKISWDSECASQGISSSVTQGVSFTDYVQLWMGHDDGTYRKTVIDSFKAAFSEKSVSFGLTGINLTYKKLFVVMVALIILLVFVSWLCDRKRASIRLLCLIVACLAVPIFAYGMGSTYVSTFSEYEALNLASFDRYINTVFLFLALVEVASIAEGASHVRVLGPIALCLLLGVSLATASSPALKGALTREAIQESRDKRKPYDAIGATITQTCKEGEHVYFISQGDHGFDYWVTRYCARPVWIENGCWSLGPKIDEKDLYSQDMGPEAWCASLLEGGYSYVVIYRADDRLREGYAAAFADPTSITDESLYRVNTQTGLLEAVS